VPAIPGKNQRIIINKQRGVSSSQSANRIFNKSLYAKTQARYEAGGQYSSFISTQNSNQASMSFGAKNKRFDAKLEMKEFFNREPGPGTYSISTAESS